MVFTLAMVLYAVLQFIAFLFVLVGTPIDMFHQQGDSRFDNTPCLTLWGLKDMCNSGAYTTRADELFTSCLARRNLFRACQVVAIISICVYGLAALFGLLLLCCCSFLRWVCLALNIAGIATLGFVWVSMVLVYFRADGNCISEKDISVYGSGFVLFMMAWCLDIINIVFLMIPWLVTHPTESGNASENGDEKE